MEFISKTENFFYQLQYCLAIAPECVLQSEKGMYCLMLKPDVFFKLINDFHIDYPFHAGNKIIELKALKDKENINSRDALKIIENYKNQYWFLDKVIIFEPVINKLKQTLKSINAEISETELNKELINFLKHLQGIRESIYNDLVNEMKALQPQQNEKAKPELNESLILFSSTEIIESLHNELKGYFPGKEAELKKALQGEQLKEFLLFPHNQNKFVEVFKRLKYNGFLLSTPKQIKDWICSTFTYQYKKGKKKMVREFNPSTVHDILTKDKGEPTKKERICIVDWLPYKSHLTRQREAE